jgi:hypothetical protein
MIDLYKIIKGDIYAVSGGQTVQRIQTFFDKYDHLYEIKDIPTCGHKKRSDFYGKNCTCDQL